MALSKVRALHPDFFSDDDVSEVSIPARLLFAGLWCFSCDNGHLADKPKQIKRWIYATDDVSVADLLRELEAVGLILRAEQCIFIPGLRKRQRIDWRFFKTCDRDDCNKPEKAKKEDSQPETRRGHDVARRGNAEALRGHAPDVDVDVVLDGDGDGDLKAASDDPAPPGRSLALVNDARDDVDHLCQLLAEAIETTGSNKPAITVKWRNEARLMLDRDGRSEAEVEACIRWLFSSTHPDALWWRAGRIQSMPKLREKFDAMRLQAQSAPRGNRQQETDGLFERAAARMGVTGGGL